MFDRLPPSASYILRRVLQTIPTILGIITVTFLMLHLAPGDPLLTLLGEGIAASPEYMEAMRAQYGLDKPFYVQYIDYVWKVFNGDLGYSILGRAPVTQLVMERLFNTLLLASISYVLAIIIGIGLGFISAKKPFSLRDNATTIISVIGYAVPSFWLGQILITVFAMKLKWLPVAGTITIGANLTGLEYLKDRLFHLIMPVAALTFPSIAFLARLTRNSMLNVMSEDYIITARAKGLSENAVMFRHAFRNVLLPLITALTLRLGFIFSGALLVETVFAWPGIGRLTFQALFQKDYPVVMGVFIITCTTVVLAVLLADILYALVDPRIRYR